MKPITLLAFFLSTLTPCSTRAAERFLLAADTQVIEIDRTGRVTARWKRPLERGIWDAWRLPDGSVAYVHARGLTVLDRHGKLMLEHAAQGGQDGVQTPGMAVMDGGQTIALLDAGASEIRVLDRTGQVRSRTPIPRLGDQPLASRYRMIRKSEARNAFWLVQYNRNTLIEVEAGSGRILSEVKLAPHLDSNPPAPHRSFGILEPGDGTLLVTTGMGLQLLHLDPTRMPIATWTARSLGLATRYLLGMQRLANGNLLVACGDYHLKTADQGDDLLAEIGSSGKVHWRVKRRQLIDQVEGFVDPRSGLEELRITNVHAYDSASLRDCLRVRR